MNFNLIKPTIFDLTSAYTLLDLLLNYNSNEFRKRLITFVVVLNNIIGKKKKGPRHGPNIVGSQTKVFGFVFSGHLVTPN